MAITPKQEKKSIDWERIENEYRAGLLSIREIAATQGVTDTAIRKRARRDGWERDLEPKIKAKADALVRTAEVRTQVRTDNALSERELVEANAEVIANVRLAHRKDIGRARSLAMNLLAELEAQTGNLDLLGELGELLGGDEDGNGISDKMLALYHAVTSLPGRTKTMKDLGDTLHKLISLERDAYDIAPPKKEMEHTGGITVHMTSDDAAL